jgi:hypothetical protein
MTSELNRTAAGVPEKDNLAADLIKTLTKAGIVKESQQTIMTDLLPYLVDRDNKIFNHGYQVGRASV